jgi:hypothetical protein
LIPKEWMRPLSRSRLHRPQVGVTGTRAVLFWKPDGVVNALAICVVLEYESTPATMQMRALAVVVVGPFAAIDCVAVPLPVTDAVLVVWVAAPVNGVVALTPE